MPPKLRRVLFWTHLTAGLAAALPIFVVCVTGTLMTYQRQMQAWADRWSIKQHRPAPGERTLDVDSLIRKVREARGVGAASVTVFADSARPVEVQLEGKLPKVLYLDPYSGAIAGEPSRKTQQVFQKVMAWHLALGMAGAHHQWFRALINAANLVALFLAALGVLLWIPRRWSWQNVRPVVTLRFRMTGRARDFNWHNAIGIWSAAPLLIIVWTAAALSYQRVGELTDRAIYAVNSEWVGWHGGAGAGFVAGPDTSGSGAPASLDALLARAKMQLPDWKAITMLVPDPDSGRVYFTIDTKGDGIQRVSALGLDRAGRAVSFVPAGAGGILPAAFVRYGHTGEAWGVAGQTVAGAASFGGAVLVWTGVALSLRRLRSWLRRGVRGEASKKRLP